jgi:hypothetical protein
MIAKAVKGRGFRGALAYDLQKEKGQILDTNMEGGDARALAEEFGEIRKLRPNLGKAVLHVSLSAAPGEHLTDDQWNDVAHMYLNGMGFDANQYVATRHRDTDHEHIHLVVNRIRFDGGVTSDSHDYRRQESLMRQIEREHDLKAVQPSVEGLRRAATKGEIEEGLRTGVASTRQRLQQLCDAAIATSRSYTEYAERLQDVDVELVPVTQLEGTKLNGLSYRLDGVMMKGSDLGKGYSPVGLAKRGVGYVKERDLETVSVQQQRETHRRAGGEDRAAASFEGRERESTGADAGANRAGDGEADRRHLLGTGPDRAKSQRAGSEDREDAGVSGEGDRTSVVDGADVGVAIVTRGQEPDMDALRDVAGVGFDGGGPRERILALGGATDRSEPAGRGGSGRTPAARDRSLEAVEAQLNALGASRYEVLTVNAKTGHQEKRLWTPQDVVAAVPWLKRMNARGNDIYLRPVDGPELVLIDRLGAADLDAMRARRLEPSATIEVSPGEFQGWIKLADQRLTAEKRKVLGQLVPGVEAVRGRYGRLAGFTNQHATIDAAGRRPYVLVHAPTGKVAPGAEKLLEAVNRRLREEKSEKQRAILEKPGRSR